MIRYCVLGGGGSFGLATSDYLLAQGDEVLGIGRSPPKPECFSLNIGKGNPNYQYRQFHIGYEQDLLLECLDDYAPEVIVNFAAQGESAASLHHCWRYYETNCTALARLTEALQQRDYLERFIHIGTSELYGSTVHPAAEDAPVKPTSPYAISKAAFDLHLMALHKYSGFPAIIMRPSNAYGEGQQLHRIIPKTVLFGLTGRRLPLHGGGRAEKSYIHNYDLARAVHILAAKGHCGYVYNVGPERPTSIRSIVGMIAGLLGKELDELCEVTDDREHQDARYWLDSGKIFGLGWNPQVGWDDGLGRMIYWVTKYLPQLREMSTDFVMRA